MKVGDFIKSCAASLKDPDFKVIEPERWKAIINENSVDLAPYVFLRKKSDVIDVGDKNSLDLSSFPNLLKIESVYDVDSAGRERPYFDYTYDLVISKLFFEGSKPAKVVIVYNSYPKEVVSDEEEMEIPRLYLPLLKRIAWLAALREVLLDKTKLTRYRRLVPEVNDYAIMQQIQNLINEIEFQKRKLAGPSEISSF